MFSPGSTGFGDEVAIDEGALVEHVRRGEGLEAAMEGAVELVRYPIYQVWLTLVWRLLALQRNWRQ